MKKHHPNCDYFIENVVFNDMHEWTEVNDTFGEPTVLNSKSLEELIPFGTFGWKPKTKEERTSLGWRGKPVMFLGWDSIYKRGGVWVMSLDSLRVQRAKMKNRNFVFGCYWKDFVDEETIRDRHRRAIEKSRSM